jgi:hypothetical protein
VVVGRQSSWAVILSGPALDQLARIDSPVHRGDLVSVAASGPTIVAVPALVVSTNAGRTFQTIEPPGGSGTLAAVHFAQSKFVAVGAAGTVLRSADGLTWSKRLSNTTKDLTAIAYSNDLWVAVGKQGAIVSSPDASFFSLRSSGTEITLRDVAYGAGQFVAVGDSGAILKSSNGENWSGQGTDQAFDLHGIAYGNDRFVAVGTNGIVHVSTDGTNWTGKQIEGASWLKDVAFASGVFVTIEFSTVPGDIQSFATRAFESADGLQWAERTLPRPLLGLGSADGALWAAGPNAYIAQARFSTTRTGALTGSINQSGLFMLTFDPPTAGNYQVLSASAVTEKTWEPVATFTNISARVDWTDTNALQPARFYQVLPVVPSRPVVRP